MDRDISMMQTPDKWPTWPVLPLIRKSDHMTGCLPPVTGYMIDNLLITGSGKRTLRVYIGNIFAITANDPFCDYANYEDIAEEWRVD